MPRPASPSTGFLAALAVLLALGHAVLALTATAEKSMTSDEIAHLTAGHAYNTRGDYRLQPENGNLPQRLAALPLAVAGAPLPSPGLESWQTADVWNYGHAFFYEQPLPTRRLLFAGRAMIALVSAATALLVFVWSRALFGWRGGFLSLVFYVCCPAFLAHGALATSDVVMTFFFLASMGAWWRHLEQPGARWAAISAVTFGLACVAKFSAVLLPPMFALAALVWLIGQGRAGGGKSAALRLVRSTGVHILAAWAIIWLFYGFRFSPFAPALADGASYNHGWGWMVQDMGFPRAALIALREWHVLPDAFLYGFAFVVQFAKQRGAFLNGEYSITGWVSFFPYTFLVKSTLPFLGLLLAGAAGWLWPVRRTAGGLGALATRLRPLTPLAALFVVYWMTSLASHLNIGHRHILPTYPVLFIVVGACGAWLDFRRPLVALLVAGLAAWHAVDSWRIRPHYLAFFNAFAGGPEQGWRHLVDSSLDWGQDLPGLRAWLDRERRGEPVYLAYFGTGDPRYEGIAATMLPTLPAVGAARPWHPLSGGIYAVSATMLQHVYSQVRGDWTMELETEYQQLRPLEPVLLAFQADPARREALRREAPAERWQSAWKRYETLRFARLCHFLRVRRPDGMIGYSILVFRLRDDEVTAATAGSLKDWSALIERAATTP